jgi:uncharacterized protein (TIGR03083 family)
MTTATDALLATWGSLRALTSGLDAADWARPTRCPGWAVQDHVSHVVATMLVLAGRPDPATELPERLDHVRNPLGRYWEPSVHARRGRAGAEVAAELERLIAELRLGAEEWTTEDLEAEVEGPMGYRMSLGRLVDILAFDQWVHEQDIRDALGVHGHVTGAAAEHAVGQIAEGLADVVASTGAPDGTVIAFDIKGPEPCEVGVGLGEGAGHVLAGVPPEPTARVALDLSTFIALGCGRAYRTDVDVVVEGDADLAEAVLADMAVTP